MAVGIRPNTIEDIFTGAYTQGRQERAAREAAAAKRAEEEEQAAATVEMLLKADPEQRRKLGLMETRTEMPSVERAEGELATTRERELPVPQAGAPGLLDIMKLRQADRPFAVGKRFVFDPATRQFIPVPGGSGAATLEEALAMQGRLKEAGTDTNIQSQLDDEGEWSHRLEAYSPSTERNIIAESVREHPTDKAKQLAYQIKKRSEMAGKIAGAQEAGRLPERPFGERTQDEMQDLFNVEMALQSLEQFTPEEVASYAGWAQRGLKDIRQFAAALPFSPIKADERYAKFRALTGLLESGKFATGGKQLTPYEGAVVERYTPTGREPGGYAEFRAKAAQSRVVTRVRRKVRLELAKTGRGYIDPEKLDNMLRSELKAAGIDVPLPQPVPAGVSGQQPSSAPAPPKGGMKPAPGAAGGKRPRILKITPVQ